MDLTGYKLVFEDDFNGTELDNDVWYQWGPGPSRIGFNSDEMVRVEDGNLIIDCDYRDGKYGPGWYGNTIGTNQKFLRGYFECRCICNDPVDRGGFWSAFWILGNAGNPKISKGGPGGSEIDVVEAMLTWEEHLPSVEHNVHVSGYPDGSGEGFRSMGAVPVQVPTCYTEYHTYGLEWNKEVYRFFVDGECSLETAWAEGVSEVPQTVLLSVCVPGEDIEDKTRKGKFVVDYVRIYQKEN